MYSGGVRWGRVPDCGCGIAVTVAVAVAVALGLDVAVDVFVDVIGFDATIPTRSDLFVSLLQKLLLLYSVAHNIYWFYKIKV